MSKLRIAYFSPLPPARSGIADYSAVLLSALVTQFDITLFATEPETAETQLNMQLPILPIKTYAKQLWSFDVALYHMGNNSLHDEIYQMALLYGGIVVLHDYGLHHFVFDQTAQRGRMGLYGRELAYEDGVSGWKTAGKVQMKRASPPIFEQPLNGRLLDSSLGVIGHSKYVVDKVQANHLHLPATVIPMVNQLAAVPTTTFRDELSVNDKTTIFASAGHFSPMMQIELALRAFADIRAAGHDVHYLLVGKLHDPVVIESLIVELGITDAVTCVGFVEELAKFSQWLATADVLINLRHPTLGETSAVGMRALAIGRPLLVFDQGWYGELPEDIVVKVPVMDKEALTDAMIDLTVDKLRRQQIGKAAALYIEQHHSPAKIAQQYRQFTEQVLKSIHEKLK